MKNDHKIKEALHKDAPEWDAEELWAAIAPNIPHQKKNRRFILLWFICAGAGLCAGAYGLYLNNRAEQPLSAEMSRSVTSGQPAAPQNPYDAHTYATTQDEAKNNHLEQQHTPPRRMQTPSASLSDSQKIEKQSITPLAPKPNHAAIDHASTEPLSRSTNPYSNPEPLQQMHPGGPPALATAIPLEPTPSLTHTANPSLTVPGIQYLPPGMPLPVVAAKKADLQLETVNSILVVAPEKEQVKGEFELSVNGGIAYTHRTLRSNGGNANFVARKRKEEHPKECVSGEILLRRSFRNHLTLATGLRWERGIETLSAADPVVNTLEYWADSAYYYVSGGQTYYLPGIRTKTITTTTYTNSINAWSRYSIPVQIGYRMQKGNWETSMYGGVQFNIKSRYEGVVRGENGQLIINNSSALAGIYRAKAVHSANLGVTETWFFKPKLGLSLGIHYTFDVQSALTPEVKARQTYGRLGLKLGGAWRF